jgi:hypothetical protein
MAMPHPSVVQPAGVLALLISLEYHFDIINTGWLDISPIDLCETGMELGCKNSITCFVKALACTHQTKRMNSILMWHDWT